MLLNTLVLCTIYQFNITYLNVILMFITYSLLLFSLYNVSFKTAISEFLATTFNEDFKFVNSLIFQPDK